MDNQIEETPNKYEVLVDVFLGLAEVALQSGDISTSEAYEISAKLLNDAISEPPEITLGSWGEQIFNLEVDGSGN